MAEQHVPSGDIPLEGQPPSLDEATSYLPEASEAQRDDGVFGWEDFFEGEAPVDDPENFKVTGLKNQGDRETTTRIQDFFDQVGSLVEEDHADENLLLRNRYYNIINALGPYLEEIDKRENHQHARARVHDRFTPKSTLEKDAQRFLFEIEQLDNPRDERQDWKDDDEASEDE